MLALAIAELSGVALAQGGSGLVGGQYTLSWSADHGSGSEQICLSDMEEFRDPAHVVAAYLNDYDSSCSTSLSVSGGVLVNTDGQGRRQRLSVRISLQRDRDC